ncbi:MFS transporter [Nocardioides daphniae]|uniref:MFS transporter n=1 Tax=Nocardioides daphniae TaxID=402297 RepID=UPI001EE98660|nr:MFS transporter [Nocardioides daphniae]
MLLLIVFYGFIDPEVGLFGVTGEDGLDVRVTMLLCAVWTTVFSLPVILTIRDDKASRRPRTEVVSVVESYRQLFQTIRLLWQTDRNTAYFLLASAVFRDGLAGVFTFGGVLAAGTFGFSPGDVIIFAVAANVVAGVATIAFGTLDDRWGPKKVIVGSLSCMLVAGTVIFFLHDRGATIFWVFGLLLCIFVGPAQSASRTFLARLIPEGKEGEIFGLYATTGRAVSFLAPAAWSGFIVMGAAVTGVADKDSAEHWGILGIMLVLALGLGFLTKVRATENPASSLSS